MILGIQRQDEMVFAQHEVSGCDLVHRMIQLGDLADRLVARGDHHALGAVQDLQCILPPHGTERMGDDVLEVQIFQAVENPRPGTVGVFLDVEDGPEVVLPIGRTHDEIARLRREHVPAYRQIVVNRRAKDRHGFRNAVQDETEEFQRLREHPAPVGLVHAEAHRRVVLQHGLHVASQLRELGDRLILLRLQARDVGGLLDEFLPHDDRPVDHREVQLVVHDLLRGKRVEVFVGQRLVEGLLESGAGPYAAAAPQVVHPECHVDEVRRAQRLQHPVEAVVAMLQFPLLAPDEGQPVQSPRQQEIAARRLDHMRRHVCGQRNELGDGQVGREHGISPESNRRNACGRRWA